MTSKSSGGFDQTICYFVVVLTVHLLLLQFWDKENKPIRNAHFHFHFIIRHFNTVNCRFAVCKKFEVSHTVSWVLSWGRHAVVGGGGGDRGQAVQTRSVKRTQLRFFLVLHACYFLPFNFISNSAGLWFSLSISHVSHVAAKSETKNPSWTGKLQSLGPVDIDNCSLLLNDN